MECCRLIATMIHDRSYNIIASQGISSALLKSKSSYFQLFKRLHSRQLKDCETNLAMGLEGTAKDGLRIQTHLLSWDYISMHS